MDPPSPFKAPTGSTALHPVSPDRMNQQRLPMSPSLPDRLGDSKHHRMSSDVQSKVAFLNGLQRQNINASHTHGNSTTAALQRAILGREEAESALKEIQQDMAEAQARERKISERLDSLMEELQSTKERQAHERQVYEKEVKRARKDAFRAGSALVKLQEDLKEARTENRNLKSTNQRERFEKEKARQEAFERAYTLAGITEEMQSLKEELRSLKSDKESELLQQQADELQIKQESADDMEIDSIQVATVDYKQAYDEEGAHSETSSEAPRRRNRFERPLLSTAMEDEVYPIFANPLKGRRETFFKSTLDDEDDIDIRDRFEDLRAELLWEKKLRLEAEDLVDFMNMECQFNCCACRRAEKEGKRFVHDVEYDNRMRALSAERRQEEQAQDTDAAENVQLAQQVGSIDKIDSKEQEHDDGPVHDLGTKDKVDDDSHYSVASPSADAANHPLPNSPEPCPVVREDRVLSNGDIAEDLFDIGPVNDSVSATESSKSPAVHSIAASPEPQLQSLPEPIESTPPGAEPSSCSDNHASYETPCRPLNYAVHSQTTTVTIPLRDHDGESDYCAIAPDTPGTPAPDADFNVPGTPISREAALAQIRARRDRARSISMKRSQVGHVPGSARRGLIGGIRDISAPSRF